MRQFLLFICILLSGSAFAERLTGINVVVSPFAGGGQLSNQAHVRSNFGIRLSLDKLFNLGGNWYVGPRLEAGNGYLTTKNYHDNHKFLSTYDNRFVTGGFRTGTWFGPIEHPSDLYVAMGMGRGYSKLQIDESGDNYYAQRKVDKIEGNYRTVELGGNWHVRRGFSFNAGLFHHVYGADQGSGRQSVDSEIATTTGIQLTSGEEAPELDQRVVQKTYGLAFGFTLGF